MLSKKITLGYSAAILLFSSAFSLAAAGKSAPSGEKTVFQTSGQWKPLTDIRADVAIVYGVNDNRKYSFEERVRSWQERGYKTHFMTGIAWGSYVDYFTGGWDGSWHLDEGQKTQKGDTIFHGHLIPYIVPTENFLKYMKEVQVKRVIDAGIDALYFEEPEFWARAGYSDAFKREWKSYYGFDWRPQHESPENTYLSNKLKYMLYYRALEEVLTFAKEYGRSKGMEIRCYVPTHSLVNYSQWMIVSPEASLASLPCVDGYIAQVWTGTSREPNYFNGKARERVFETAFLEYGSMESMTAPTGRKMFFLTDPIEDRAKDWADYKRNYEATFTAQLLYPMIDNYEVMPWPDRIYEGLYRTSGDSDQRGRIPRHYSTQMQVMINTLNDMPLSDNKVSGSAGISVLMANSLMFQRFPTHEGYEDPQLSNFYGQALPLLKRGVPVSTVHIENLAYEAALRDTKVLLMSYSNMKPLTEEYHDLLARWVADGGIVVYSGRDDDPFQSVQEWWNTGGKDYAAPADNLFEKMGIGRSPAQGEYKVGKGTVYVVRQDPKEFVLNEDGDEKFISIVGKLYETGDGKLELKNHFRLDRGNYTMIAVLDESVSNTPYIVSGLFIDLFDPSLPILSRKKIEPGHQAFLYDIGRVADKTTPQVLASASRVYDEKTNGQTYSFIAKSPANTNNIMRILLPGRPSHIGVTDVATGKNIEFGQTWDAKSKTCLLSFENNPDGIAVRIGW